MDRGVVVFLQGPPSGFWAELADEFQAVGWTVDKIHLAPAEPFFWRRPGATRFAGSLEQWSVYLQEVLRRRRATAVCLYSDGLPHHREAVRLCRRMGVRVFVFENGYLRPDWITCQEGGMYEGRALPRDPGAIKRIAEAAPRPDLEVEYRHSFFSEAWREVAFHLTNGLTPKSLWRFDHDRYYHPVVDYSSWVKRLAFSSGEGRRAMAVSTKLIFKDQPYYLVPLQLQSDYSVRIGSRYDHVSQMIEQLVTSFAAHAPKRCALVFKVHPHDNGRERWRRIAMRLAKRNGLERRVHVIDGGPFGALVASSRGVAVINSTSGLHAIRALKPTIALGHAVYDMPGLTHQSGLDRFWRDPDPTDTLLVRAFIRALVAKTQIKGSFFLEDGRRAACKEVVRRIVGRTAPPLAAEAPAPSLARGRAEVAA
ncbi:MAG: capsular biosynthesis protein [Pseudomonadota bacterium]